MYAIPTSKTLPLAPLRPNKKGRYIGDKIGMIIPNITARTIAFLASALNDFLSFSPIAIADNAAICYGSKPTEKMVSNLVHNQKHLAVLRFAYATVHVEGISIACQNQLVRSKHLDFMVESKRYVSANKGEFKFIYPDGIDQRTKLRMWEVWNNAIWTYQDLLSLGVKKEDARAILPANTSTKMNITGNLQGWMDFMKLRLNSHAQLEIRTLASKIYDLLSEVYPRVFTNELKEQL